MATSQQRILFLDPAGWQKEAINLGLTYLCGALKRKGHDPIVLDLNNKPLSDDALQEWVRDYFPTIVGISAKTATAKECGRLAGLISSILPEAIIIAGGPHVTLCAETFLKQYPGFQYGLMGESELSITELVDALANDKPVEHLSGLAYRQNGSVVINSWRPPEDLDALALPYLDGIVGFNWTDFRYPIVTSRGCPFQCVYCCVNKLTGSRRWRSRKAEAVVDELELVAREKGIQAFEIWDDNFTLNVSRAKDFCRQLLRRNLKLSWYCHNGIRADRIDLELAQLMKESGCTSIAFGIESGNVETFDSIRKGEPLAKIVEAVNLLKQVGIDAVGYFIIGLPGDTLEKLIESVRFERSLQLNHSAFRMLVPYPHTEVWEDVQNRGRMFCDITESQHFAEGAVPVTFELPEFPKEDMVRGFYISKYFELFDLVRAILDSGQIPTVVYVLPSTRVAAIAGMIHACDTRARQVIVGESEEPLRQSEAFLNIAGNRDIVFTRAIPLSGASALCTVFVSSPELISPKMLMRNSDVIVFTELGKCRRVKKHVRSVWRMPDFVLSTVGNVVMIRDAVAQRSMRGLIRNPFIRKRLKKLLGIWYFGTFVLTKFKLVIPSKAKKRFPFEDYPTHM